MDKICVGYVGLRKVGKVRAKLVVKCFEVGNGLVVNYNCPVVANAIRDVDINHLNIPLCAHFLDINVDVDSENKENVGTSKSGGRKRKARDDNSMEAAWEAFSAGVTSNDFLVLKAILSSSQLWISRSSMSRMLDIGYGLALLYRTMAN
ncbi:hypothetical protein SUGI_0758360 [Cryptomeria japonica]|nr:hypothetical protein SUGI_0758360 [Cryptomeria japonica]